MKRWMICLDIDETQIEERTHPKSFAGEAESIRTLRDSLNQIKKEHNALIVHTSNGMRHFYDPIETLLAEPDYLTADASTLIYQKLKKEWILDSGYMKRVQDCGYDPDVVDALITHYPSLEHTGEEHQTLVKRSFRFKDNLLSREERLKIFNTLKKHAENFKGIKAFYVEGHKPEEQGNDFKGPWAIIDILPALCTKGECIQYIAEKENIDPDYIIVAGNGDNDISMFRPEFRTIAVGNAQPCLKEHSLTLIANHAEKHIIAKGIRSQGVLEGLHYFGLLPTG